MDERLMDALEDCRARLARGESPEQCLAAHPEQAAELRALLPLVTQLRALRQEPTANFTHAAHGRFHARLAAVQAARRVPAAGRRPLRWLRRLALPAAAAAVLVGSGFGLVTASADALPNSPLYKVQQAHEQVAGYLARTPEAQAAYHLRLANQRLRQLETARALAAGPAVVDQLMAGMVQQTALAAQSWAALPAVEQAKLVPKVRPLLVKERAALQWEAVHGPPRVAKQAAERQEQLRAVEQAVAAVSAPAAPTSQTQEHPAASATPQATSHVAPARKLTPAERLRRFLAAHRQRLATPAPVHTPQP